MDPYANLTEGKHAQYFSVVKIFTSMLCPQKHGQWLDMIFAATNKASKTETLDLCQLPRPPFEIHKMINLPASVKIFKNKLKN